MKKIRIVVGNVEISGCEAIVNAANYKLAQGTGVCGAIYRAAGPSLEPFVQSTFPKGCYTGKVAVTPGFDLEATGTRFILHAVGPVYSYYPADEAAKKLRQVYRNLFDLCYSLGVKSVGVVALSTGVFGYPVQEATQIAAEEANRTAYSGEINFYVWPDNQATYENTFASVVKSEFYTPATAPVPPQAGDLDDTSDSDDNDVNPIAVVPVLRTVIPGLV